MFKILYKRINELLSNNTNVIIDATNITNKSRRMIFENINVDCEKLCYIINTPYEICLERLKNRNNKESSQIVLEEKLKKYYYSFQIPFYNEGWDEIKIDNHLNLEQSLKYCSDLLKMADGFDQQNKHHIQDLGTHMKSVGLKLRKLSKNNNLINAGYYHDIGKLFTQFYKEGDPNAHYYNHDSVGTYELLCNAGVFLPDKIYSEIDTLEWLFYVNYHMIDLKTKKSIKKWSERFGEESFNNLLLMQKCDKSKE